MKEIKPTLRDIAKRTDLTTASVSMILSGKMLSRFPQETIEKVERCAQELGYVSKQKKKAAPLILIVCPSVINPYFATLLQGMESAADNEHWNTIIANTYWSKEREEKIINMAKGQNIQGVIFAMIPQQPELVVELSALKPVIVVGDKQSTVNLDTVDVDNFNAGFELGRYLIDLGHRHIVYLSTALNKEHTSRVFRLSGLKASFKEFCPEGKVDIIICDVSYKTEIDNVEIEHTTGQELASRFLAQKSDATAIVAINDMIAYGVLDELKSRGYKIPEDYSVCGFDNIYPSKFIDLELTTVDQFINNKGESAFNLIKERILSTSPKHSTTHVEFASQLVVRKTTAPPKAR